MVDNILKIIEDNFLCVRRLPFEVISYWNYSEGDEDRIKIPSFLEDGTPIKDKKEIIIENLNLEYFQKTPPQDWDKDKTPEYRYERYKNMYPNGRKLIKNTKIVEKGGWWYVKKVNNTDSTVRFSNKTDKFFAPTLEEAVQLFLESQV